MIRPSESSAYALTLVSANFLAAVLLAKRMSISSNVLPFTMLALRYPEMTGKTYLCFGKAEVGPSEGQQRKSSLNDVREEENVSISRLTQK